MQDECQSRLIELCKEDAPDFDEVLLIIECKVDVNFHDKVQMYKL